VQAQARLSLIARQRRSLASQANIWQFDVLYDSVNITPSNKIIAQVAPNAGCICNDLGGQVFVGDLLGTAPVN
jgi:hypothetical protein